MSFYTFIGSKSRPTWLFATIEVSSRLWVGSLVGRRSYRNTKAVLNDVILRGRLVGFPLIATDGFEYYFGVIVRLIGHACVYGQVIKSRRNNRVIRVERRLKIGAARRLKDALLKSEDSETLNTSFVERLNLTIRQGSAYLRRRSAFSGQQERNRVMNRAKYQLIGSMAALAVLLLIFVSHFILPENAVQAARSSVDNDSQEKPATRAKYFKQLVEGNPDAMKGFQMLGQAALKPGALDTKTKELIALGLAVAARCDACITGHTRNAVEAGATKEEIIEALGVTILMGGGPSLAYSTHALEAMDQLESTEK